MRRPVAATHRRAGWRSMSDIVDQIKAATAALGVGAPPAWVDGRRMPPPPTLRPAKASERARGNSPLGMGSFVHFSRDQRPIARGCVRLFWVIWGPDHPAWGIRFPAGHGVLRSNCAPARVRVAAPSAAIAPKAGGDPAAGASAGHGVHRPILKAEAGDVHLPPRWTWLIAHLAIARAMAVRNYGAGARCSMP